MVKRAVFLDRDGTILEEVGYLSCPERMHFLRGAGEGISRLNQAQLSVVVCTNQAGVARGYFPEEAVRLVHAAMQESLKAQRARVDGFYYCPHHATQGVGSYRMECACRKPRPGMLQKASLDLDIDLKGSFVVGDKISDLQAGQAAGCRVVLVRTGYGREMETQLDDAGVSPDHVADDLLEASQWILQQGY